MSAEVGVATPRAVSHPIARPRLAAATFLEVALLLLVFGLAVVLRLIALGDPTDISDEGIRGVQLRLLSAGFKPVSEIFASQGPLSLWLFYPLVKLLGPDILAGRLTVVLASLVTLAGSAALARSLAGPVAGVAAAAILAISPVFLENSRLAFVEVPSIAPTVLAILCLARHPAVGGRRWLVASAVLLAAGALAKPIAAVAAVPTLLLLVLPNGRSWRARLTDLLLYGLVGATVSALAILAVGPNALYEQMVVYRVGARAVRGWDLLANATLMLTQLRREGWGILLATALGVVCTTLHRRALGWAVLGWLLAAVAALLAYSPLWEKHISYLLPPLAILAGAGLAPVAGLLVRPIRRSVLPLGGGAAIALVLIFAWLPTLAADARSIVYRHAGSDLSRYADDLRIVEAASVRDDFVVVDDAYLAMLTGRLTPPFLADLSWNRILARSLTAERAIDATTRFDTRVIILQDDHLGQIQRYLTWADREYVLVKSYQQRRPVRFRRVYVSPAADLGAVKAALLASLVTPTDVTIGPARLLGYDLESTQLKAGSRVGLTLMFEALQNRPPEHALVVRLRDASGEVAQENEWKVGDGTHEMHTWPQGGWQAQSMRLLVDDKIAPGTYSLTIALHRPNGATAPVTARSGARALPSGDELDLGTVTVLR